MCTSAPRLRKVEVVGGQLLWQHARCCWSLLRAPLRGEGVWRLMFCDAQGQPWTRGMPQTQKHATSVC